MAASILIADDDAIARRLVENMVQKCGYDDTPSSTPVTPPLRC